MARIKQYKVVMSVIAVLLFGTLLFQNCGQVQFANTDFYNFDSQGRRIYRGQTTLGAEKPNPPLNLFFVVDNSASMLGHQIDLGAAFSSVFSSNLSNLSNFDTRVYVFSTASTVHTNYLNQIPNRAPSSISSVPATNDANLYQIPGNIFGMWAQSGANPYGTIPFNFQIKPSAVLDNSPTGVTPSLFIPKQGSMSAGQYQAQIAALTQDFQARLAYLNPSSQTSHAAATDVSSGLCTVSRILKHSSNFIQPGDSAAFIVVSDDNDRLNVRNPNNNQCLESVIGSQSLIDGKCGHYETKFNYFANATVSYKSATTFNYHSGTNINFSYPSKDTCSIKYSNGYQYTYTYTALKTEVSYTKCNQMGDGTCISTSAAKATIDGNYVGAGNSCTVNMSTLVTSPAPGTGYSCVAANVVNQAGSPGVDANSNGSQCSSQLLSTLSAANRSNISCTIGARNFVSTNASNQTIGSCDNYCAANPQLAACSLVSVSTQKASSSIAVNVNGLTCSSTCPDPAKCGNGSIASYITSQYGSSATCDSVSNRQASFKVNGASNLDGTALSCNSSLSGLSVTDSSNNPICSGKTTVKDCASSLQVGTTNPSIACTVASTASTNMAAAVNVGCSSACSASGGLCTGSQTVGQYIIDSKRGLCTGSSNGGAKSLATPLRFKDSIAASAGCSAKCSDTVNGSCDGLGYGATDGSTVDSYIASLGGGACSSQILNVAETGVLHADSSNPQSVCSAGQVFFPSGSPYPGTQSNFVAGDATHKASDFMNYISTRSQAVFGTNNKPAFAVITHLPQDNLYGTDVGTDYINLASLMGSNQVASIMSNYSVALANISDFIVKTTQSQIALNIPPQSVVFAVSYLPSGSGNWQQIPDTQWSYAGGTLSISPAAGLKIGDQIQYQYRDQ